MSLSPLLSTRAQRWRDWALFALAASSPALAVGWLGLRALEGQEDAARRQTLAALQSSADGIARAVQDDVDAAATRLARVPQPGPEVETQLRDLAPAFADPVVLSQDHKVSFPPPPSSVPAPVDGTAPASCALLADSVARSPERRDLAQQLLADCEGVRSPTGRWLWPIVAVRSPEPSLGPRFADWVERYAQRMRRAEREATRQEATGVAWLRGEDRERVMRALSPAASLHEAVARTLEQEGPSSALREGADATGFVRWREGGSWGVLRQLPDGRLAGFVTHGSSVESACRRGWPKLPPDFRVEVRSEGGGEGWWRDASLAPSLGVRVVLADPGLPARQAARARVVMGVVGAVAMGLAFLVAAVLFARMRAAKRLGELRTGFVSAVSHELRTPIASVRMLAELLEQGRVEDDEKGEVHAALAREAKRMGDTVDRLLGFSRMAAGRYVIERKEASVVEVVEGSIATFEERNPELPKVERRYVEGFVAEVDAGQVQLAVDNLLGNAHKYAPKGTPYGVRVAEVDGWVVIEVTDHGPGIPRRERKRVFRPFERGDDRLSSAVQGSGIGLSLVQHVAQAHGGVAEAVAAPGGGACVRLRFPRRQT